MEHARPAALADLDDLARLWDMAVAELDGQRGGTLLAGTLYREDPRRSLADSIVDRDRLVVTGLIDEVPVGLASVCCDRDRREPICRLELIYVQSQARQVGVAEAMVGVAVEWSRALGCVGLDAPALPGNRAAKAFFETHGFLARLLVMHFPLREDP